MMVFLEFNIRVTEEANRTGKSDQAWQKQDLLQAEWQAMASTRVGTT